MRYGAGPNGPMRTLGQYMLGSGATFGWASMRLPVATTGRMLTTDPLRRFFMSIGSIIRTEGLSSQAVEAYERARRQPVVLPRRFAKRRDIELEE